MMKHGILYRTLVGAVGFLAVSAFTILGNVSYSQAFSAGQIYAYARSGNTNALNQLRYYLETQDGNGNTALCMAVIDDNLQAYNLLKQYGANTQPHCLSSALAGGGSTGSAGALGTGGTGSAVAGSTGSATVLGMSTTGWLVTGAVVAGGAGVAAAAGGGGGGGGGSSGGGEQPDCIHGSIDNNVCVCNEGWTGSTCNTAVDCGSGFKTACATNEYTDGSTCKSGNNTLKKCKTRTVITDRCEIYSPNSDSCSVCTEGWSGSACETANTCTGYKASCAANEYVDESDTCKSGNSVLKKCIERTVITDKCAEYSPNSDACATCVEGWSGNTCETANTCSGYKASCAANEYVDESDTCKSGDATLKKCKTRTVISDKCTEYSPNSDACATCVEGWSGNACDTADACTGYKASCSANEYEDESDTCQAGDATLKKCKARAIITDKCAEYSPNSDACAACVEGWNGIACDTADTCTGYKASCAAGEYEDESDTCKSGDATLKKCKTRTIITDKCSVYSPNSDACATCVEGWNGNACDTADTCTGYKASCATGEYEDESDTCKSGDATLKKCKTRTIISDKCTEYSPNSDACATCVEGWSGDACETANACTGYKENCAANEYEDESDTCQAGDTPMKKCVERTIITDKCSVYSPNSDACATCVDGWNGDACDTANTCTGYKASCSTNEYEDESDTCKSGDATMKKCIERTVITDRCEIYSPKADTCAVCVEGWDGDTCETAETCTGYKASCAAGEYEDESDTCKSGDATLKKCIEREVITDKCEVYSPNSDACATCEEGWSGDACETADACTGYKENCAISEYEDESDTCQAGDIPMKKCIERTIITDKCAVYSPNSDVCATCVEGWNGDACDTANTCTDYKASCANDEYEVEGDTCKSGDATLKKCNERTVITDRCEIYSPKADTCAVCVEGWDGDTCETAETCTGYKASCAADEYEDESDTCKSGDATLKKCIEREVITDKCEVYSPNSDACATCEEGWSGDACETADACTGYKASCAADEYEDESDTCKSGDATMKKCIEREVITDKCAVYSPNSDKCTTCVEGWSGDACDTANTCTDYKASCAANEYEVESDTCKSGDAVMKKCNERTVITDRCEIYSPAADTCAVCVEGWDGDTCETAETCTGYKASCAAGEYEVENDTCKSGDATMKKCIEREVITDKCLVYSPNSDACATCVEGWSGDACETADACTGYKASCADGEYEDESDTCKSGDATMKMCKERTVISDKCEVYSPNSDACATCVEGWTGDDCDTASTCDSKYKASCAAGEYEDDSDTCKSGDDTLKTCKERTVITDKCLVYSPNSDACATCAEGWTGDDCETAAACTGYKASCAADEYEDESDTCKSGDATLKMCKERTVMTDKCEVYSPNSDICTTCVEGWSGNACEMADVCGSGYKSSCAANEYVTEDDTCQAGDEILKRCTERTVITDKCEVYSPDSDACATCVEGWTGDDCETAAVCTGYKASCAAGEYEDESDTCKSGDATMKMCKERTVITDKCTVYSPNSDACATCVEGWTGDDCETAAACTGYKASCAAGEYEDESDTCKSGEATLKMCKERTVITDKCETYSPNSDACATCVEGWNGDACDTAAACTGYKASCAAGEYEDESDTCKSGEATMKMCKERTVITDRCEIYNPTADACAVCEEGWDGDTCETAETCTGYKASCAAGEYEDESDTCKSGDATMKKCNERTVITDKCEVYSPNSDACATCVEGWSGGDCETANTCTGYKASCAAGEYEDESDTCKSGEATLKMCKERTVITDKCSVYSPNSDACATCVEGWSGNDCETAAACTGYKASCAVGEYEDESDTCKSGDATLKMCKERTVITDRCEIYNPKADTCAVCVEGWDGDTCETAETCGAEYVEACAANEYEVESDTCKSGEATLKKCNERTVITDKCAVYSSNSDKCATCIEGWNGDACETANTCTGYKSSCTDDEYEDESDVCMAGDVALKKCKERTVITDKCEVYLPDSDGCDMCVDGWDGNACDIANTCEEEYVESCAENEYEDEGDTCKSGDDTLKKCNERTVITDKCLIYSPNSDACAVCVEGWDGIDCETVESCTGYKASCAADEYEVESDTCKSGEDTLKKCNERTIITDKCEVYSPNSDKCTTCVEGWSGDACDVTDACTGYKASCAAGEYEDESDTCQAGDTVMKKCIEREVITDKCAVYSPNSDACTTCVEGWNGDACNTADACTGYKASCAADEYEAEGDTCKSGDATMKKCNEREVITDRCVIYSPKADTCAVCVEGWDGDTCETMETCTGYKASCAAGEYEDESDTCKSGDDTMKMCKERTVVSDKCEVYSPNSDACATCAEGWSGDACETANTCTGYKASCAADEYEDESDTCKSGDATLKKCIEREVITDKCAVYSPNSDVCTTCVEGWSGDACETADACTGYKASCADGEYEDESDTCKSGDATMKKCIEREVISDKCEVYSPNSDACATCEEGWSGDACDTANVCTGYKASCAANEYEVESDTCKSGDATLKKCNARTIITDKCLVYNPNADKCTTCVEGWSGDACDTAGGCGDNYRETCEDDEYETGETCQSGDAELKECAKHTEIEHCDEYSQVEDICEKCAKGWSGDTCETANACTGYKASCAENEYEVEGDTCKSGDATLKKCEEHTPIEGCEVYSTVEDICVTCVDGWTGTTCEEAVYCGEGYRTDCLINEYETGHVCKSGNTQLKECAEHTPIERCEVYSTTAPACETCATGWTGDTCETPASCGDDYREACDEDEYETGKTCLSGSAELKECKVHTDMPKCIEYNTTEDTCKTCVDGWMGSTCESAVTCGEEYKTSCGENEYVDESDTCPAGDVLLKRCREHNYIANCEEYKTTEDTCKTCSEGWTGDTCETPATCGDKFKVYCSANEYSTGETCKSGDAELQECEDHTEIERCKEYSPIEDVCAVCKDGWSGDTCETASTCDSEYKVACAANEYTTGSTCMSGDVELVGCFEYTPVENCAEYNPTSDACMTCNAGWTGDECDVEVTCGAEYVESCEADEYEDDTDTCISGNVTLKKCKERTVMTDKCNVYSQNSDACATCVEGWSGDDCETANACTGYKASCAADEYEALGDTCMSGNATLKKCKERTVITDKCQSYSQYADSCVSCEYGWTGSDCETASTCSEQFKLACEANEYETGAACQSGNDELVECAAHTLVEHCATYNPYEDRCSTCVDGWTGDACDTANTCGLEYKDNCSSDEYASGKICHAGDAELKECIVHDIIPNCVEYSTTAPVCKTCAEGWTGDACETKTSCGAEYKAECAANEYETSDTCEVGGTVFKKCAEHTLIDNCSEYSSTADVCATCFDGWTGEYCATAGTCGAEYVEACAPNEYASAICKSGYTELKKCTEHTQIARCVEYSQNSDTCEVCEEGWTGNTCETASTCGAEYVASCAANEYETTDTCKSGTAVLKKCAVHTEIEGCVVYSQTEDICVTCVDGWAGSSCEEMNYCGDAYRVDCSTEEYTTGHTCMSGNTELKECVAHTSIERCLEYSPTSPTCKTCEAGWTGDTCETVVTCEANYRASCAANEYETGETCNTGGTELKECKAHTNMPNCLEYNTTEDTCKTCVEGWTGNTCGTASSCGEEYKIECAANEYTTGDTCPAGGMVLKKCVEHTPIEHCDVYSPTEDTCATCVEGWTGNNCNTASACGAEYVESCAADEYASGICKSGDTELKKCKKHTTIARCIGYSPTEDVCELCEDGWTGDTCVTANTCGAEYVASCAANEYETTDTCKTGNTVLKKCAVHAQIERCLTYSTTEDICVTCVDGWLGGSCEEVVECGSGYKIECSANEYENGAICMSGNTEMKQCVEHTPIERCLTYSPTSPTCAICEAGWTGDTCETQVTCGAGYRESCAADEYETGETCNTGGTELKECKKHTTIARCVVYSSTDDICATCEAGWTGDTCETVNVCGEQFKSACAPNEYMTSETCWTAGTELFECLEHDVIPHCNVYSTVSNTCDTCENGWIGNECELEVDCGDTYKTTCATNEYTNGETCKSGEATLKNCIPHGDYPNCDVYSPTADICSVCKAGWEGDYCNMADENHIIGEDGNLYEKLDCVHGLQVNGECECTAGYTGTLCDEVKGFTSHANIVRNNSSGSAYGLKDDEYYGIKNAEDGTITITGTHGDEAVGIDGPIAPEALAYATNDGTITISASDHNAYGVKGYVGTVANTSTGSISIQNTTGDAYGICSASSEESVETVVSNAGEISISSTQGNAYGINGNLYSDVVNETTGEITISDTNGRTSGVGTSGNTATNKGQITISGSAGNTYGVENTNNGEVINDENATVTINNGTGAVVALSSGVGTVTNKGNLVISNIDNQVIGIEGAEVDNKAGSVISITNSGTTETNTYGIKSTGDTSSAGEITITGSDSSAYGIYVDTNYVNGKNVVNSSTGSISISSSDSHSATGIYALGADSVTNAGGITVQGGESSSGIMSSGDVINTATGNITVNDAKVDVWGINSTGIGTTTNYGNVSVDGTYGSASGISASNGLIINETGGKISVTDTHILFYYEEGGVMQHVAVYAAGIHSYGGGVVNRGEIVVEDNGSDCDNTYGIRVSNKSSEEALNDTGGVIKVRNSYGPAVGISSAENAKNKGSILVDHITGTAIGMEDYVAVGDTATIKLVNDTNGQITVSNSTNAYGARTITEFENKGTITLTGNSNSSYGIKADYFQDQLGFFAPVIGEATNKGTVNITGNSGTAYGMYAVAKSRITNAAGATISISNNNGVAYGMYAQNGEAGNKTIVNNAGNITITGTPTAYGIYSAGSNVIITNIGTISINGSSCSGNACNGGNYIVLNGATFNQNGVLQSNVIKLDDYDGVVTASDTSKFIADEISGDLTMNSDVVKSGFDTTYTVSGMIEAANSEGLKLLSQSALFDATLDNNSDAVMTMKSFNDVVENQSLADFLKLNYAAENNESLFSELKGKESVVSLNSSLNELTGADMFNRFTFEDMTMMRELNADMNNALFSNDKKHMEIAGNVTPWNFDGNSGSKARYALYSNKSGNKSFGWGVAFSNVRSNNGKDNKDGRYDQTFQVSAPFGYDTNGFKFITAPRFGYAYGTYDREGYAGKSYDGKVEKRMFGLMNEVRYPMSLGKWNVAPSAEFNMLGYNIKGHEDAQKYSLNIKSQNNYSVEGGFGIYANRDMNPTKNSLLKFNIGLAIYHEFANPYELELGMNGMDGTFKVRDERRKDNRAVLRSGFDYRLGDDITLSGTVATYLDGTTHNNANLDFKYNF